jgi:hypoxanthine phosphoribosyltransferase
LERPDIDEVIYSAEQIRSKVSELALRVTEDYREGAKASPLLLVGVLKGAFIFLADLARLIELPLEFDFMALSSYGSATKTSGVVRILKDLDTDITGRHVLLVEDIIDTGLTLSYLLRSLRARGPASLEICALLNKQVANKVELPIKYEGFSIPDVFVVGYGLDCAEGYRNLPYIASVKNDSFGAWHR